MISVDEEKADLQVAEHGTDANGGRTGSLGSGAKERPSSATE